MKEEEVYELIGIDVSNGNDYTIEQVLSKIGEKWSEVSEIIKQQVSDVIAGRESSST